MLFSSLAPHANKLKYLADENAPALLTALGVSGTVVTAVLTGRATFKAAEIIEKGNFNKLSELVHDDSNVREDGSDLSAEALSADHLSTEEKVKLVWKCYIPPAVSCVITITSIIMAHRVSSGRLAAVLASSAVTERAFSEYKEKIQQKFGERKATEVRDEIAQDRVTNNPVENSQVIMTGTGDVLCYDNLTGRYFTSSMEKLRGSENNINHQLLHSSHASLTEFFELVGLAPTTFTDSVGWCMDIPLKVEFSTCLSTDGRPCIAIDFNPMPKTGYENWYE